MLRLCATSLCRFVVPVHGLFVVLFDAHASGVTDSHTTLRVCVALLGGLHIQFKCFCSIALCPEMAHIVSVAKIILRDRTTASHMLLQIFEHVRDLVAIRFA